jgi:hypothetical protein
MKILPLMLLLAVAAAPAHAQRYDMRIGGPLLQMSVYDRDSAQQLPVYRHDGRYYVAGVPGHRYELQLSNRSGGDVLSIVSVDGVNAISGDTADWSQDDGYVLDSGSSYDVKGWRKSHAQVAGFVFADAGNSYAARTGRPANVGVIGVAVFAERESARVLRDREADIARNEAAPPVPVPPSMIDSAAQSSASTGAPASEAAPKAAPAQRAIGGLARADDKLGTGHGAREYSHVDNVDFERATRDPAERLSVWYDSYQNLVAQGIIDRPIARRDADPFPNRFVADPPAR